MAWINAHRKYLTAALSATLTAVSVAGLGGERWVPVVVAVAGALGVYYVPNTTPPEAKP